MPTWSRIDTPERANYYRFPSFAVTVAQSARERLNPNGI
jgi:hypothetical protein